MSIPRFRRFLPMLLAALVALASAGMLGGAGIASAATPAHGSHGSSVCAGTPGSPGVLTGYHRSVRVTGTCVVNAGHAYVQNDVSIARGGTLLAAFALNDQTGHGTSSLNVGGNVFVGSGGTLILGCEAAHFACIDDPSQNDPTLSSSDSVGASIIASQALGVVVHNSWIGGSVLQNGGGGGVTCTPSGPFAQFSSPVYSDYEDNSIGGNLNITGLQSCWLGALRDQVHGSSFVAWNTMADPDAMEVNSNVVLGNLSCIGNSPAVQFGDSMGTPNRVGRFAGGQCGFHVLQPNPVATSTTPAGPLEHISVRLFRRHHH